MLWGAAPLLGASEAPVLHLPSLGQTLPQAKAFHILSPFLSLPRGQWQPEESEDYVSNRCADAGETWVRLGSRATPCLPPFLPA